MTAGDVTISVVEYTLGVTVTDAMSEGTPNPKWATLLPRGTTAGIRPVEQITTVGETSTFLALPESQQNSTNGLVGDDGFRQAEIDYGEYGAAYLKKILWDGSAAEYIATEGLNWDEGDLTITASESAQPVTNAMLGALARVTMPSTEPWVLFGRVIDVNTGSDSFTIEDPNGDLYDALNEIEDAVLTVFDHHDATIEGADQVHTAGVWEEESIEWHSNTGLTTFTNSTNVFPSHATGWFLQPDASVPVFFPIISASVSTLTVAGNLSGVAEAGDYYFIIPPVGIDKTDGAVSMAPGEPMTRKLAFGYQYTAPVAGVATNTGIKGRQTGNNLTGQYNAWNRWYDPNQGRWTTPDPAASPWANLLDYARNNPRIATDPIGLHISGPAGYPFQKLGELWDYIFGKGKSKIDDAVEDVKDAVEDVKNALASYGYWCGPGGDRAGDGTAKDDVDECCKAHDQCFQAAGIDADAYMTGNMTGPQAIEAHKCNKVFIDCLYKANDSLLHNDLQLHMYIAGAITLFTSKDEEYANLRIKRDVDLGRWIHPKREGAQPPTRKCPRHHDNEDERNKPVPSPYRKKHGG